MKFGSKFDRASTEKESSSELSTSSIFGFKEGTTVVHLLDDLDDWTEYWEHYDANIKLFYPCTGDRQTCVGCVGGHSSSHRWLANAFVVESDNTKPGYVNLYKFPKSLMNKILRQYDKRGSLLEHDWEVIRVGNSMDTEYDLERGEEVAFDFDKHMPSATNHEEALQAAYDEYQRVTSAPDTVDSAVGKVASRRASSQEEVKINRKEEERVQKQDEDPPSKPQAPESQDAGLEVVIDEDALYDMDYDELSTLARRGGLTVPKGIDEAKELAAWIYNTLTEDD